MQEMRNESRRKKKTYRFVPVGMSHGAIIYRAAVFFPRLSLAVTLLSALIGSDVDLKEEKRSDRSP